MLTTIHRFTPPTCTLEIQGKQSPLSRWIKGDILKRLKFKLSFDDPRLPSYQQVLITGNIQDLEQLKTAVDDYIQDYLHNSLAPIFHLKSTNNDLNNNHNKKVLPFIEPEGLTQHKLFFGNLNHDSQVNQTILTTVQLFDLVTALEAYSSQIHLLPEVEQKQGKKIVFLWGGIAAVILAGVGITAILLQSSPMKNIASSPQSESSDAVAQFDDVIAPNPTPSSSKNTKVPKINESLSSTERLPPPPAVDTLKPKPNIPDPADYSLSQVARQSGLEQLEQKPANTRSGAESIKIVPAGENPENPQLDIAKNSELEEELADSDNLVPSIDNHTQSNKVSPKPNLNQEITAYFKDKWQPPSDLKQSLEYRLFLNKNGSINKVVPMGKASTLYLSNSNIPVQGEVFISPLNKSQKSIVRLLLNPDGGVQVLIE